MGCRLISNVAIKGALNAALFEQDSRPGLLIWLPDRDQFVRNDDQYGLYAQSAAEWRSLPEVLDGEISLYDPLREWSRKFAALNHLIAAMDPDYDADLRNEYLLEGARLRQLDPAIEQFTHARLLGCPLPENALIEEAAQLAGAAKLVNEARLYRVMKLASESGVLQNTINAALETLRIFHFEELRNDPMVPSFAETERELLDSGLVAAFVEANLLSLPNIWNQFVVRTTFDGRVFKSGLLTRRFTAALQKKLGKIAASSPAGAVAFPVSDSAFVPAAAFFPTLAKTVQDWIDLKEELPDRRVTLNRYDEEALSAALRQIDYFYQQFQAGRITRIDQDIAGFVGAQLRKELPAPACRTLSNFAAKIEDLTPAASLEIYDLAILIDSNDPVARTGRAETLRSLGRFGEALKAYEDTVAATGGNPALPWPLRRGAQGL
jgi:hypothetical protein